jgi:phosphatidate phosphatase APP1
LVDFLEKEGFPDGTLHLKVFRLRDSRLWRRIGVKHESKSKAIETILQSFPRRRFVLVGDSGERDPEIYGAVARNHPHQVVRIWIRDVTGHSAESARFKKAFRGAPADRWSLFRTVGEFRAESNVWTSSDLLQPVPR